MNQHITLVIADDHPMFRKGFRQTIEECGGYELLAETGNGLKALQLIEELVPDIVVLDIDMPGMNGLDVAKEIRRRKLSVAVIMLTNYYGEDMFNSAIDAGVRGYVLKESAIIDLLAAINTVSAGKYFFSPSLSEYLIQRSRRVSELLQQKPEISRLTVSERQVLKLISQNKTSKEIADELFISYRTVETHRANISGKLNIHGVHSLVKFAIENKSALSEW